MTKMIAKNTKKDKREIGNDRIKRIKLSKYIRPIFSKLGQLFIQTWAIFDSFIWSHCSLVPLVSISNSRQEHDITFYCIFLLESVIKNSAPTDHCPFKFDPTLVPNLVKLFGYDWHLGHLGRDWVNLEQPYTR